MEKKITMLFIGLCFLQCASGMKKVSSSASISVSKNIENLLFKNCDPRCLQKFQNMEINQGDGDLYINAFNVGQGNFVILRKENRVVIVDAGGEKRFDVEGKIDELLKDAVVDAVFVTHPHDDHFSLLNDLLEHSTRSFFDATFYLSGKEDDWKTKSAQAFLKRLRTLFQVISDVEFLDNKQLEVSLLNGVVFKTFYLKPAVKREPNKLSLLLQVSYLGKNVLFTGDAEGDSIARLFQTVGDLSSVTSLVPSRDKITEIVQYLYRGSQGLYRIKISMLQFC